MSSTPPTPSPLSTGSGSSAAAAAVAAADPAALPGTLAAVADRAAEEARLVAEEVPESLAASVLPGVVATRSIADYLSAGGNRGWTPTALPSPTSLSGLLTGPDHAAPVSAPSDAPTPDAVVAEVRQRAAALAADTMPPDLRGVMAQSAELLRRHQEQVTGVTAERRLRPAAPGPDAEPLATRSGRRALRTAATTGAAGGVGRASRTLGTIAVVLVVVGFIGGAASRGSDIQDVFILPVIIAVLPSLAAFVLGLIGLARPPRGAAVGGIVLSVLGNPLTWLILLGSI